MSSSQWQPQQGGKANHARNVIDGLMDQKWSPIQASRHEDMFARQATLGMQQMLQRLRIASSLIHYSATACRCHRSFRQLIRLGPWSSASCSAESPSDSELQLDSLYRHIQGRRRTRHSFQQFSAAPANLIHLLAGHQHSCYGQRGELTARRLGSRCSKLSCSISDSPLRYTKRY